MLSFLSPLFLVGAVTAAIPLVLHLLKREPDPRVEFSAVKLLKQAPVELTSKRHLRELLLLALRIAALLLLSLAFARPFFASSAAPSSGVTMVAIDTSYSMSAPGQLDRAMQLAKAAVDRAPAGDLLGVLTFDDVANVVARPSADRVLARSAIDAVTPGFGATRYRAALGAAVQAFAGRRGTIALVTDLQESGWDANDRASIPVSARIEILDVGAIPSNLALTSVRPAGDRIVAAVRNAGGRAQNTRVRLVLDGRPAGDMTLSVAPNTTVNVALPAAGRASAAEVAIDDPEGIQADNVRYTVLDEKVSRPSLLAVTSSGNLRREAFYVQQAFEAGAASGDAFQVTSIGGAQLSGWDEARLAGQAAVLLLSTRGLERRGREVLAAYAQHGGGVLVAAGPDVDGGVAADVLGAGSPIRIVASNKEQPATTTLAPVDVRHPVFQPFSANVATLGLVKFRQVARIDGTGCQTLARFTTGESAVLDCAAGEGRGLVFASDLNNRWNDFPLHATFVPFLHEAARYLASARPHSDDYLVAAAPAGARRVPGIATMPAKTPGDRPRRVAVNVDPRESDPARISAAEFESAVTRLSDVGVSEARVETRQEEDRQHLWQYALALMVALVACEGLVASRTA